MKTTAKTVAQSFRDGQIAFSCQEVGLLVRAMEKLEADNEELIRGMTEMAERFTAAMAQHLPKETTHAAG